MSIVLEPTKMYLKTVLFFIKIIKNAFKCRLLQWRTKKLKTLFSHLPIYFTWKIRIKCSSANKWNYQHENFLQQWNELNEIGLISKPHVCSTFKRIQHFKGQKEFAVSEDWIKEHPGEKCASLSMLLTNADILETFWGFRTITKEAPECLKRNV